MQTVSNWLGILRHLSHAHHFTVREPISALLMEPLVDAEIGGAWHTCRTLSVVVCLPVCPSLSVSVWVVSLCIFFSRGMWRLCTARPGPALGGAAGSGGDAGADGCSRAVGQSLGLSWLSLGDGGRAHSKEARISVMAFAGPRPIAQLRCFLCSHQRHTEGFVNLQVLALHVARPEEQLQLSL